MCQCKHLGVSVCVRKHAWMCVQVRVCKSKSERVIKREREREKNKRESKRMLKVVNLLFEFEMK